MIRWRHAWLVMLVVALFTNVGFLGGGPSLVAAQQGFPNSLCVAPSGTGNCFASIQAAVDAAEPGAVIYVAAGTYHEAVTIAKSLTLQGAGADTTTLDAAGADNAVHITADDVRLQGFTVTGARLDGILINANRAQIVDNTVMGNATLIIPPSPGSPPGAPATTFSNITLQNASDAVIANNTIGGSRGRGLRVAGSEILRFPEHGIEVTVVGRSDRNIIVNNHVHDNTGGCGIVLSTDASDNVVLGNTITNNVAGVIVSALPPFGLPGTPVADHLPHSDRNLISNNLVQNNRLGGIGIVPISGTTEGNVVAGNTVTDNGPCDECEGASVGIFVVAGRTPASQAAGNLVGPGNIVDGQQWGIFVGGTAANTQVFDNRVTVPPGGIAEKL
ncbi:MAG TPA: right-handed parallel beta-helix repeat-containing protein [Chloroflexota bacterium]|nr:right-handed parallel beta-helix repeat-containing protein [Gemmatimonadales bacterium]HZU04689.1 right-handed parallel beta-helix repeat-containing protein [Chloroflexota bacterium]